MAHFSSSHFAGTHFAATHWRPEPDDEQGGGGNRPRAQVIASLRAALRDQIDDDDAVAIATAYLMRRIHPN